MKALQKQLIIMALLTLSAGFVNAETRYFIEGVVGQAEQKNAVPGFYTIDDRSKSRAIRGGFEWSQTFGLELGHSKFGQAEESYTYSFNDTVTDQIDTEAHTIGLRMRIKLGRVMSLIGRAGWAAWDLDYAAFDSAFPSDSYRIEDDGIDTYYGFGLQFQPEEKFRIAVEYTTLDFRARLGAANTHHEIDNYSVSVGFLF